ncbi:MAG: diphthine--ammonia ligase [Candidatus Jordarchaeum sp.]|uniref:diphthine--ammonia ligase n=1 Tax=Candidatus Jordarchaeum sp. TaxID=2823881 RepID=UPI00404A90D3
MKVAVLFSGGKDSSYVIQWCIDQSYTIKALVSIFSMRPDSYMFHVPNIGLTRLQAEATGFIHIVRYSSGIKEEEVKDLEAAVRPLDIDGIVSGAVASEYQRSRVALVSDKLGLRSINPLWHMDSLVYLKDIINRNFNIIFTGVYALGFNENWLGRRLDDAALKELVELNKNYGVDLSGEGGEYETLVLDAPFFKRMIKIIKSEIIWEKDSGYLDIKHAELMEKGKNL